MKFLVYDICWKYIFVFFFKERWLGIGRRGMSWDVFKVFLKGEFFFYLFVRVKKIILCIVNFLLR